jgi:hypothetical protein
VSEGQLALFLERAHVRLNKTDAGLADEIAAGPERLLAEMVKRGLGRDDLEGAAALCLALDATEPQANNEARREGLS